MKNNDNKKKKIAVIVIAVVILLLVVVGSGVALGVFRSTKGSASETRKLSQISLRPRLPL